MHLVVHEVLKVDNHCPEKADFNSITTTSTEFDLSVKESLFISIMTPNLNELKKTLTLKNFRLNW